MWRERIIETKKAKGISTKMMAEKSRMPAETITRILNSKTEFPRIDTVLDLGESVGLSPWELFAEPTDVANYQNFWALQEEVNVLKADMEVFSNENAALKSKIAELKTYNERLLLELKHKEEIIAIHNYYNKLK